MRNRKHAALKKKKSRTERRRKRMINFGLFLGVITAASIVAAAYTNRADDPFASHRGPPVDAYPAQGSHPSVPAPKQNRNRHP